MAATAGPRTAALRSAGWRPRRRTPRSAGNSRQRQPRWGPPARTSRRGQPTCPSWREHGDWGRCQDAEQHREESFHDEPRTAAALVVSKSPVNVPRGGSAPGLSATRPLGDTPARSRSVVAQPASDARCARVINLWWSSRFLDPPWEIDSSH